MSFPANPNFIIKPEGEISESFLERNILDFNQATKWIAQLEYKRNADKYNLKTVFADQCGTCSTKHALLKALADENGFQGLKLMLGIFKMNAQNTSKISQTLAKYQLEYIPEAHNYLNYNNQILDFTRDNSAASDFENDLLDEIEISATQITDFKVAFHKKFLQNWLNDNKQIPYDIDMSWKIREKCIRDLSS